MELRRVFFGGTTLFFLLLLPVFLVGVSFFYAVAPPLPCYDLFSFLLGASMAYCMTLFTVLFWDRYYRDREGDDARTSE